MSAGLATHPVQHGSFVIERRYELRDVPDAIRHLETGHARGKLVVSIRQ